jgi:hypothetical protein
MTRYRTITLALILSAAACSGGGAEVAADAASDDEVVDSSDVTANDEVVEQSDATTEAEVEEVIDYSDFEPSASDFGCILDMTPVRRFYLTNLLGMVDESVAVARGEAPLPYPVGTLIQLFPAEAMVKRAPGFSDETADWEFYFLENTASGSTIQTRGAEETVNAFGGNCFGCHEPARDNDFVCELDHGCEPLNIPFSLIQAAQDSDVRCN